MFFRLALAQINATVGDLSGNRDKIIEGLKTARKTGACLVAFPEMAITGYPPEDLLLKPDFVESSQRILKELAPATKGLVAVIGSLWLEDDLYNGAAVLADGKFVGFYAKHFLPNYGVFDENRYFNPGSKTRSSSSAKPRLASASVRTSGIQTALPKPKPLKEAPKS
jgi:NAD+ synthase (glutamine-hydrolysing)